VIVLPVRVLTKICMVQLLMFVYSYSLVCCLGSIVLEETLPSARSSVLSSALSLVWLSLVVVVVVWLCLLCYEDYVGIGKVFIVVKR
jgi:hypothetical protein